MPRAKVGRGLSCLQVYEAKTKRDGHFTSTASIVRRRLGRPGAEPKQIARARHELAEGLGIVKLARMTGLGTGTVHKLKREMATRLQS